MTGATSGGSASEAVLDRLWRTILADDYGHAPQRRPGGRSTHLLSATALLICGLLIAAAAMHTRTDRPASEMERVAVIDDIESREEVVAAQRERVEVLTADIQALQAAADVFESEGPGGRKILPPDRGATGPGIVIIARSGDHGQSAQISDLDLQLLVNGLWYAGAEAVAINGQRIGSTTAIRWAGESITVNYRSLNEPYEISAIGPPTMEENWTANPSGRHWRQRAEGTGLSWDVVADDELTVPEVPRARLRIAHATPLEEAS